MPDEITRGDALELSPLEAAFAARLLAKIISDRPGVEPRSKLGLHELASKLYGARRQRRNFFDEDLFSDPAWDMLLSLYGALGRGELMSVTALCMSADVPYTTALRWKSELERQGFLRQQQNPEDGRSFLIGLSDRGIEKMEAYLRRIDDRFFNMT